MTAKSDQDLLEDLLDHAITPQWVARPECKLKAEPLRAWCQALRDPNSQQAREVLCSGGTSYCCLGLGAKLAGLQFTQDSAGIWGILRSGSEPEWYDSHPPSEFWKWLSYGGRADGLASELITLNDDRGFTFPEIADYLEAHYAAEDYHAEA